MEAVIKMGMIEEYFLLECSYTFLLQSRNTYPVEELPVVASSYKNYKSIKSFTDIHNGQLNVNNS